MASPSDISSSGDRPTETTRRIGRYLVFEQIGKGAGGIVYRALDPAIGRELAIKELDLSGLSPDEALEARQRFVREARAVGNLRNDNIVFVYDFLELGDALYLVMELVPGGSLSKLMGSRPMAAAEALSIVRQVAAALDCAHAKGIVHRDIKPGNILVASEKAGHGPLVKVADFGIARVASQTMTLTMAVLGTPRYMAPEQFRGSQVTAKADQFSLGVLAYQLLCGKVPFTGHSYQELQYRVQSVEPAALQEANPALPAGVDRVVRKALAKDPGQRFATCGAFAEALGGVLAAPVPKPAGLNRVVLAGVAALLLAAVVLYSVWPPGKTVVTPPKKDIPAPVDTVSPPKEVPKAAPAPVIDSGGQVGNLPHGSLALGATRQFSANNATRWRATAGSITADGLYTAPAKMPRSGKDTVTATGPGGRDTVTVGLKYPVPEVDPDTATLALGAVRQFSASNTTRWIAAAGKITSGGRYTAPAKMPRSGTDTITATGPGGSGTATVTLKAPAPEVEPDAVTVTLGATQRFSGSSVTSWSAVSGSINSAGLYTAPSAMTRSGTDTVTATGLGGNATATVRLRAPPKAPEPAVESTVATPGEKWTNPKDGLIYVRVPAGSFTMGCSPGDTDCNDDEKPARRVTISSGFSIGQTPVTQEAYLRVTGKDPSNFKGAKLPVETVNWNEAQNYCRAVGMELPTETQWEYAARAGSKEARYGPLDAIAWYSGNSGGTTHPVGLKRPNAWSLYDMLGNVWQWTASDYNSTTKTLRGGSWYFDPWLNRVSYRSSNVPALRDYYIGFRCVGN